MSEHEPGQVIAIDGPDGSGKTKQIELLATYFVGKGRTVHKTRTSGGTPIGEKLRTVSLSAVARPAMTDFHISLAMLHALAEDVVQRKARGEVVLIDRSPLAMVAYNAYGSQMEDKQISCDASVQFFAQLQVDLLIFLSAAPDILEGRRKGRGVNEYFESQGPEYHKRVTEGYGAGLEFLRSANIPKLEIAEIDGTPAIDVVHAAIVATL